MDYSMMSAEEIVLEFLNNDDFDSAIAFVQQGIAAENGNAMKILADMYLNGVIYEQNEKEAANWYRKSAELNDPQGLYEYGICLAKGTGETPINPADAARCFWQSATSGFGLAQFEMGLRYGDGDGVEKNSYESFKWLKLAAEQGIPEAQMFVGESYIFGDGVEPNLYEAIKWLRYAAQQGEIAAQATLAATLCNFGGGNNYQPTLEGYREALQWALKAAQEGNPRAHTVLGVIYIDGLGVAKDLDLACEYIKFAADSGENDAINILRGFKKNLFGKLEYHS